jgi:hypothetical protein
LKKFLKNSLKNASGAKFWLGAAAALNFGLFLIISTCARLMF